MPVEMILHRSVFIATSVAGPQRPGQPLHTGILRQSRPPRSMINEDRVSALSSCICHTTGGKDEYATLLGTRKSADITGGRHLSCFQGK